ncbi:phytase [Streptomyces sp. NPDC015131]|uniref:phytase n=1 Tax=Streptomyces sp. NPDC015131 TaxID=3364941 RepID=UPI0037030175
MFRHCPVRPAALLLTTALLALTAAAPAGAVPAGPSGPLPGIAPRAETATLYDDEAGGAADADDPAIWRDAARPDRSLVIATAKEGGLRVYDLDARQVQAVPAPPAARPGDAPGRFNNVDLVHGVRLPAGRADIAVTTDRGHDRLRFHRIVPGRPGGPLADVTDPAVPPVFSADQDEINAQHTAYGLATWRDAASGRSYALVSRRGRTTVALLELLPTAAGTLTYRTVRSIDLPSSFRLPDGTAWSPCGEPDELPQVEGMVVDPANGMLYAGQEDVGIWRVRADLTGAAPRLVDRVREYGVPAAYDEATEECVPGADPGFGGSRLAADVEGLTLIPQGRGDGYLLASSQGDDTFALYDREVAEAHEYEGGFRVVAGPGGRVDGSEECDGAAALNAPLGRKYPRGLLVVQDGHDTPAEDGREATNFAFVDLGEVLDRVDR